MNIDTLADHLKSGLPVLGNFWWMVWNAILALIPALLAIFFFKREDQPRRGLRNATFGIELALVLLFLPNAPYVATDSFIFSRPSEPAAPPFGNYWAKNFPF